MEVWVPCKARCHARSRMINKLVIENLKHRAVRTLLSAVAIGVQVTMMLTLVGLSEGMLDDQARRSRAIGADIIIRAPDSAAISLSNGFPAKVVDFVRKQPHVVLTTGTLVVPTGDLATITGM